MEKSQYTIYIDFAINNSQTFDPMNSLDKVLESRKIAAIEVNYVDDFHNLFLHLSEQFNEQTDNIGLKDKVNLKIVRNDENNYFIVYYEYIVDDIQRLPIKPLDNYLSIMVSKIIAAIYDADSELEICSTIPGESRELSLSWRDDSHFSQLTVNQNECRYSLLISSSNYKTNFYEYVLNNGWHIKVIFKDMMSVTTK